MGREKQNASCYGKVS